MVGTIFYILASVKMEHALKRKNKHICLQCDKTFNRIQRLQAHQRKITCGTVCLRCNHKFRTRAQLVTHQKNSKLKDCDHCEKRFCSDSDYNNHQKTTHATKCDICNKDFSTNYNLKQHQSNIKPLKCDACDEVFCYKLKLLQHKQLAHAGAGVVAELKDNLSRPIFSTSMFEQEDGYKQMIASNSRYINDDVQDKKVYLVINKKLSPSFTYKDLEELIRIKSYKSGRTFKINLGFGCLLRDLISGKYRYYYVSHNNLLFDRAFTISKHTDLTEFMKKLMEMDIEDHYYMLRPSSGWVLAGIPNVQIRFMFLGSILG